MNPVTTARWTVVAVGLAVVVGGVGALGADASAPTPRTPATDEAVEAQGSQNDSAISPNQTIEAIRAVENRTNGTVIGAELRGQGSELDRSTFAYELDVLADNQTRLVAEVYAGNASVIGVETANESDGLLDDLLSSDEGATDGEATDAARNASSLRSAAAAVEIAANQTDAERSNLTVTGVALGSRNDTLVYNVTMLEAGGEPREIVVSAERDSGGVVTTDPED